MRIIVALCVVVGSACGGAAPTLKVEPVPGEGTPSGGPADPPGGTVCIPPADVIAGIAADATDAAVQFCVLRDWPAEGEAPSAQDCWTVDLATGALAAGGGVASYGPTVPPYGAVVDPDTRVIKVCPNGPQAVGCVDHTPKVGADETVVAADVDAGHQRIAYVVEKQDGVAPSRVVVEEAGSGKALASFGFGDASYRCGMPQFVGDNLVVAAGVCAGPSATGEIYTDRGRKVADVGPAPASPDAARFDVYGFGALALGGDLWAFLAATGETVVVQDVRTGAIARVIDVSRAAGQPVRFASPGEGGWTRTPSGKLVIVAGGPELGSVFVVDPMTGAARKVATPPLCAAPVTP